MLRLMVITALAFVASSLPARADADVEVTLSSRLEAMEARIDAIEQIREKRFRKYQHYDRNAARSPRRFANARYRDVAWANELLVPEVAAYGVRTLLSALVNESLNRAGADRSGMNIRVHLEKLHISDHPLARLHGSHSYASGSISLVDQASGQVVRSIEFTATPAVYPSIDLGYKGPDFAFEDTDPTRRIGPTLAYFVMKGLGELYEDVEFPRPIAVTFTR